MNETLREKQQRENRERAEALRLRQNEREQERTSESLRDRLQRDRANRIEERRATREGRDPELLPPPKSPLEVMADFIQKILEDKAKPALAAQVEEPAVIQKRDVGFPDAPPRLPQRFPNQRDQVFDGGGAAAYSHPFMMFQNEDKDLLVEWGNIMVPVYKPDNDGKHYLTFVSVASLVSVGAGVMNGGPSKSTGGTIALAANTTYGVWLVLGWQGDSHVPDFTSGFQIVDFWLAGFAAESILVDTTYTDAGDYVAIMAANTGRSYFYLGQLETDADKIADIRQYQKSDIIVPPLTLPHTILSTAAAVNDLGIDGTDNGIYYDTP